MQLDKIVEVGKEVELATELAEALSVAVVRQMALQEIGRRGVVHLLLVLAAGGASWPDSEALAVA